MSMIQAKRGRLGLLAAALLVASPALGAETAAKMGAAGAAPACPSRTFERFLKAFERSAETQRAFTRLPLPKRHLDLEKMTEGGDPATIDELLPAEAVKFPIFPDAKRRALFHLPMGIKKPAPDRVEVTIRGEDNGQTIIYHFERDTCWRLVFVDDEST